MTDQVTVPFSVELVSGPKAQGGLDDYELRAARRALARLKALIGREGMRKLMAKEYEAGNASLRELAERSNGEFKPHTIVLKIRGLKAAEFLQFLQGSFENEAVMLAGHPEHYVIATNPDKTVTVIENLGPFVANILLPTMAAASTWTEEAVNEILPDSEYPYRRIATMRLADGTVVGRVMTQFGDTEEGFSAYLTFYFPALLPEEAAEGHSQHAAVEFRNWMVAAAEAKQARRNQ